VTVSVASDAYTEAIREARQRGYTLSRQALAKIVQTFKDAAARVEFDLQASDSPLTEERAQSLKQQIEGVLQELEQQTGATTDTAVRQTVDDVVAIHEQVVADLLEHHIGETPLVTIQQGLDRINTRAVAVLAARNDVSSGAAGFQTLMKYHLEAAGPDLDRLISSAIARGVSSQQLTRDVADFLANGVANLNGYGLTLADTDGLASLQADAARIATSETLNALRESQTQAMMASSVIDAVQWGLSGNHFDIDECDLLAEADWYGLGPGFYPPEKLPVAPHPWCRCGPKATRLRHPSTWNTPRPPAPALAINWEGFDPSDHVSGAADWSDLRTARVITALRRSVLDTVGRRARRAA
jgi:hypothetical protein